MAVLYERLTADMVLVNAKVVTFDARNSVVEAVAVKSCTIVATGSSTHVMKMVGKRTEVVDLGGKTVLPGLIDTHTHPSHAATRTYEINCHSPPVRRIKEIPDMVAAKSRD